MEHELLHAKIVWVQRPKETTKYNSLETKVNVLHKWDSAKISGEKEHTQSHQVFPKNYELVYNITWVVTFSLDNQIENWLYTLLKEVISDCIPI